MADNTQEQGNIRNEFNQASVGMNMDNAINQIPKGQLTYALNAALENFDSNSTSYQNEQGNEFCLQFPANFLLIGTHFIPEKNKHLFFITNPTTEQSEIGYMDNNDCVYRKLVGAPCLNFNIQHPIHKVVHKITNCTTEIYWTDGFNPRRYLDIENIPYKLSDGSTFCNPLESDQLDCNQLKLQPDFNIPGLAVIDVITGGNLTAGTLQFAVQYCDAQGNPYTSYYSVTNPTPIADTFLTTVNFNYPVGKSVIVEVSNLDTTGQFQYYNLAVIKTVNNVTSVELAGTYFIDNSVIQITYTGQIVDNIRLSINDIFEKQPYYEIAEDLTAVQDVLVWDGLVSIDRINYQSIANQILLQWETYKIPATENYANELNATNLRGYLRDEVYAFEIVFLLRNGKQTDGFHIPGRAATLLDLTPVDNTNNDFIGEPDPNTTTSPYWKIYNTASVIGNSTSPPIGNATAHQYGSFAYWESTEEYPCNTEVWGTLAGQNIRHHKFPDVLVSPIYESALLTGTGLMVMQNDAVYPIGVKIDTDQIQSLISSSTLTDSQKEDIVGYKIVRGDRSTNKSIVAKGMLRNVGKYTREEEDFIYPNYPYNDLGEDPFILENNNAYSLICETWLLYIRFLNPDPKGGPDFVEIELTDCNTNKRRKQKFTTIGEIEVCSISKPIFIGNTSKTLSDVSLFLPQILYNQVGYANYDTYELRSTGLCRGWRAVWNDAIEGPNTPGYLQGWGAWEGNRSLTVNVVVDSVPGCIEFCKRCGISIQRRGGRRSTKNCKDPGPLQAINSDASLKYRQIFNSPETSFGQPFLGNVLKLEQVMYGAGKSHFVQVKDNAKYRLLTYEAQLDALNSSRDVAGITASFNVGAMFAVYQSYLTIYINGITRKNYAYSFNSRANYDYSATIPNDLGIKQREIDVARYLIPVVQNVGDKIGTKDVNINNYQRETSVYIKTKGTDNSVPALPFPSDSPNMSVTGIKDYSRFTIGDSNLCATPNAEQDISVVSYYASMKNIFVNQWGQIYTYSTIDTGFQKLFNTNSPQETVFGGDTFISRFAFKTKLPYFIDNRVNGLDDSDIFYDEIGNIGYPKYWHSARSILKDWNGSGVGTLVNIISYKAHNFDCFNNQEPAIGNPDRTFYDGYFYLFAYGIPNFYCESSYNTDLRQAFNNKEGDFWPHVSNGIPDNWLQESFVSIANDNTYNYNITYSKQNKENFFSHIPFDWNQTCYTYYPFRAIYSDPQNTDVDNRINNWLTYKAVSYFDFPQNYGKLISLDGIQNRAVLARFENKSLMYDNLLTIDTSNPQAAYMGNPLMFRKSPPIDFAETDLGYVGSQNKLLLKIPQGQLTIDAKRGQVFLIQGTQAMDLSQFGSGMNRFFTDHLAFEILRYFPEVDTDNHFNGVGLHAVYDSKFDRIIISKLDYIPLYKDIKYYNDSKEFYLEEVQSNGVIIKTLVYLTDPEYFCNKSWTISYNINTKSWVSFHSYIPNWYIAENNFFYSGINGCCTDVDLDVTGSFDAIVGRTDLPETTTTTTTLMFITTTSTTTLITNCVLRGYIEETSCVLDGTAVITVEPIPTTTICSRPAGLTIYSFTSGYQIDALPPVVSSGSYDDACSAIALFDFADPATITVDGFNIMAFDLNVNSTVYLNISSDCNLVPDGWYFTEESSNDGNVYNIVGGVIEGIYNCNCSPTTTTTTTINIEQCCSTLFNSGSNIYYYNSNNTSLTLLDVPGFTTTYGIAMTANYLWSLDTAIEQWDIFLTPFSATYNTSITLPVGFVASTGLVAKNDDVIITTDISTLPVNVVELDVTSSVAVLTVMFALPTDRINITNMLYTTDEKLIMVTQDTVTFDYYITQFDYTTGAVELDINIGVFTPTSIFECECSIMLTDASGKIYIVEKTSPYTITEMLTLPILIDGATQVQSCIVSSLIETTTTTTTI